LTENGRGCFPAIFLPGVGGCNPTPARFVISFSVVLFHGTAFADGLHRHAGQIDRPAFLPGVVARGSLDRRRNCCRFCPHDRRHHVGRIVDALYRSGLD